MHDSTERRLRFIFILLLIIVVGSWFNRDTWFEWAYLRPDIKLLLTGMWLTLVFSLFGLLAIFITGLRQVRREGTRITLLTLTNLCCVACLMLEGCVFIEFHGGERCFPYNLTAGLTYEPPFLPLSITIDTQGNISLSSDTSIQFEIGTVSVVTNINSLPASTSSNNSVTILVIRHRQGNRVIDSHYFLRSSMDSVRMVTTGPVVMQISKNNYFIDVSRGEIESTQVNIFPANSVCNVPVRAAATNMQESRVWSSIT